MFFEKEEEIRPFFAQQLEWCGVDYFDFYLMHAQNAVNYEKYKKCRAYEIAFELKEEGKIKHVGLSFHDKADVLERILTEYPQVEVVQIQFNYLDYESPIVEARKCYEVCRRHGKPVIIMEPVKGGTLAKLPEKAVKILDGLGGGSAASYAIRFAAGFEGVMSVLSGMGNMEMVLDNIGYMGNFKPLDEKEMAAVNQVVEVFKTQDTIACTSCEYCVSTCPQKINIPALFACLNSKRTTKSWNADFYYNSVHTAKGGKASSCIKCGKCEAECPQHLPIRDLLVTVAEEFEKK
jgi:predicted aldo/keto reductase-like oxidoreductase